MASLSDSTDHRPPSGPTRDPGAPLTGRTLALFAGMVLTGSVTLGLIASAIASLLVPGNQIGLRPYLVSSLPAVLMLFIASCFSYGDRVMLSITGIAFSKDLHLDALKLGYLTSEQFDQWVRPEDMIGPKK